MSSEPPQPRKRRRIALSCEPCRKKKIKCDQELPCSHCKRSKKVSCHYLDKEEKSDNNETALNQQAAALILVTPNDQPPQLSTILNRMQQRTISHRFSMEATGLPSPRTDIGSIVSEKIDEGPLLQQTQSIDQAILQTQSIDRAILLSSTQQDDVSPIRGLFSKSRFYGQSHWAHSIPQFEDVLRIIKSLLIDEQNGVFDTFVKCKTLAKSLKTQALIEQPLRSDPCEYVLPKAETDLLIEAYLRTFQTVYQVLHVSSFMEAYDAYWLDPAAAKQDFVMQLLLVMAIGSAFTSNDDEVASQKSLASQWVYTAQYWLSSPFEKARMNLAGIQVHCLLLLARQVNAVGGDLISISAGSLLNKAMTLGLHIDPSYTDMPQFDTSMRRRLWATVLEIVVQSAMDIGVKPLISASDYNCKLPEDTLTQSLPIRLEIARYVNDFALPFTYEEALKLGSKLTSVCCKNPDTFQGKLIDYLTLRFLLALHYPFAMKAKVDHKFQYSRKVTLQAALVLSRPEGDFARLLRIGGSNFRGIPVQVVSTIADELIEQLGDFLSSRSTCEEMRRIVEEHVELTVDRIKCGDTSVKGHVLFSSLLAKIKAIEHGASVNEAVSNAAIKGLRDCHSLLQARMEESGTKIVEPPNFEGFDSWFGSMEGLF